MEQPAIYEPEVYEQMQERFFRSTVSRPELPTT